MRNIKLIIEYDGTNHAGWQVQKNPGFSTIQGNIEEILSRVLRERIRLAASGRTDSGVHAAAQVANFRTKSHLPPEKIQRALNFYLPEEMAITGIREVPLDFHSRFSAKSKLYRYTILNRPVRSPLARHYLHFFPSPLDVSAMQRAAKILVGSHDFKSFQASDNKERFPRLHSGQASTRTIKKLKVRKSKDCIYIDIEADGFLYNMVRNIVGTLIEVGRGKIFAGEVKKILAARDRTKAGPAAPAKGLCLLRVKYRA